MAVRQIPAARLGHDVLLEIFYHLETDDSLCVAARVCRAWTAPAQELPYNTLCLSPRDPLDPTSLTRGSLLARTMRTAPHLAALVRFLSLHTGGADADLDGAPGLEREHEREQVEWIHRLPAHGLARFRYAWATEDTFDPAVLAAPAVRTVPHLIAHGPQTPASLRACLALPRLQALELDLSSSSPSSSSSPFPECESCWDSWMAAAAAGTPRLRRLLVRAPYASPTGTALTLALFRAFAPQLATFQLHALFELFAPHSAWAAALAAPSHFVQHSHSGLRELVLSGGLAWPQGKRREKEKEKEDEPFMDAVVRAHRALERIRCPRGTYSDAFFRDLPPSVRVLELYVDVGVDVDARRGRRWRFNFPHARALVGLLREAGAGRRVSGLREVRFLSLYRTTVPMSMSTSHSHEDGGWGLVEAARDAGVRLVCVRVPGLYTPVQCMAEVDILESSFCSDFCY